MEEQKRTILYIEDDPASRRLVERTLKFAGYAMLVAERGLQGVDLARQHHPDLILTDINLPDLSGQEIASTLRRDETFNRIPIVALTAQGHGSMDWEMAFAAGINGYITKPIDIENLPNQIAYYLNGGRDTIEAERLAAGQTKHAQTIVSRLESRIRDLENANHELIELDKMKDAFIQITAHELRTPLTLVYGYTRLLADQSPMKRVMNDAPEVQMVVEGLNDSVERLQMLIEEIVTISRLMTNRIELTVDSVDIGQIIRRALKNYGKALDDRNLTVHFDATQFPHDLRGDADLLYLVMSNLISNAMKFTPDGGHIHITGQYDTHQFRLMVRDTGIGIDKARHKKIFERFQTSQDVMLHSTSKTSFGGGGLGLGLSICKGAIEAHGGQIWVESEGHDVERLPGAEFVITLPMISTHSGRKVQV